MILQNCAQCDTFYFRSPVELGCNAAKGGKLKLPRGLSTANKDTGPDLQTSVSPK